MQVNSEVLLALLDSTRSPMRPPQPVGEPSGADDCQTDCWSLCENSLGGTGTLRALYCWRVMGATSGPTLSCTAARPALNSPARPVMDGCSAYCTPPGRGVVGLRAVPARSVRLSAMLVRMPL
jgi:hypothetical protein